MTPKQYHDRRWYCVITARRHARHRSRVPPFCTAGFRPKNPWPGRVVVCSNGFFFFFYNTWILLSFRQDLTRLYDMKKKIVKPRRTMSYYHVICHHGESKLKIFNAFAKKKKKKISFKRNVHVTPRASDAFFHEYAFMNPIDLMRTTRRKH